ALPIFDPAVGHAQGNLVGVADTVLAGEAVFAPQRRVAEAAFAGIEDGDLILIFFGHVEVEQAWLEGLPVILAEPLGVAIEIQARVDTEDRYAAVGRVLEIVSNTTRTVFATVIQVQVVLRVGILDGGFEEAPAPVQRQADAGLQVDTLAFGAIEAADIIVIPGLRRAILVDEVAAAQIPLEADELAAIGKAQATRLEGQRAIQRQLRQAFVRRGVDHAGRLVGVYVERGGEGVAPPGQGAALVEEVRLADAQLSVQVLEVVGIADVGIVDFGQQARIQAAAVLPAVHPALVFVLGLQLAVVVAVVQVGGAELAFAAARQVAEFAFHQQAA